MADENNPTPLRPFQNIAIAFSGGGFRAASFSLGALSYLHSLKIDGVPLIERISFISSASGGSITAMSYIAQRHQNVAFETFFQDLLRNLSGETLLEAVLETLNNDQVWNQPGALKQRNLINSFAKVYDEMLFKGETMSIYFDKKYYKDLEVCFNATEFYRGLSFRFQTDGSTDKRQLIGNNYLWFDNYLLDVFKKIKLADVLAASSCFPMGFEPILYPEDFTYSDAEHKTLSAQELRSALHYENYSEQTFSMEDAPPLTSIGFMDGGITDNQGLSSLMLADKKRQHRKKPNPFDLIIVTDVASYFMDSYEPPHFNKSKGWREDDLGKYAVAPKTLLSKIHNFQSALLGVTIVFSIAACLFTNLWIRTPATILAASALTAYLSIVLVKSSKFGKMLIVEMKDFDIKQILYANLKLNKYFSSSVLHKMLGYLKLTKLGVFEQMVKARISSVMIMVTDVNLKQVRRLIYEKFYNDPCWDNRRVPNFIYEMSSHNKATRTSRFNNRGRLKWTATEADKQLLLEGLENLHTIAEEARIASTTLWFDSTQTKNETLKKIITAGQFSTCANLLEYVLSLERKKVKLDPAYKNELEIIKSILEADLIRFKAEPYFLYDELTSKNI